MDYPNSLKDCKQLSKTQNNLVFHEELYNFLVSPVFIMIVALTIVGLLSFGTISCAYPSPFMKNKVTRMPLHQCNLPQLVAVASDFPAEIKEDVRAATDYWNKILNYRVFIFAGDYGIPSTDIPERSGIITIGLRPEEEATSPNVRGYATLHPNRRRGCVDSVQIEIHRERMYSRVFTQAVLAHELGHALGLAHSDMQDSLMYYNLGLSVNHIPYVTYVQIQALINMYNL